jgi:hypothetical protein
MLDTDRLFLGSGTTFTFIEPFAELLRELLAEDSLSSRVSVIQNEVQDVPISEFQGLECNDFLFIDSNHVSKVGSDVNYLIFEVLPALRTGVIVHFHDIFTGFEYPREWVLEGRCWNEAYLLRAFLMFNNSFEVLLDNPFVVEPFPEWFRQHTPICPNNPGGSLWLRVC